MDLVRGLCCGVLCREQRGKKKKGERKDQIKIYRKCQKDEQIRTHQRKIKEQKE